MKFRTTKNWEEPNRKQGLLFFAQMIEELTYPLTMSTYKPSIMNTALLCIEANETIEEIEAGNIKPANIDHVLDELCHNLESDPIALRIINVPRKILFSTLKERKKISAKEKQITVNLLLTQMNRSKYLETCEQVILEQLGGEPNYKLLRSATRTYVTTLVAGGTSQKHIHNTALDQFHYSTNRIADATSCAREFFSKVRPNKSKFTVIFKVDQIFRSVQKTFTPLKVTFWADQPEGIDTSIIPSFFKRNPAVTYAKIEDVEARDKYQARDNAELMLKGCSTFLTLFHHREKPNWSNDSVVIEGGRAHLISHSDNAMHHGDDLSPQVAAKRISSFFEKFSLNEKAFIKFIRSAQLHSLAVVSNSIENQLLNLWIAIESLIPQETKGDDDAAIAHIAKSLVPILNYDYAEKLVNSSVRDMLNWNKHFFYGIVKGVGGKSFADRLLKILILPEHADRYKELEEKCAHFVLLKDRIIRLKFIFSSPENCAKTLDTHANRLEWQIRRIYRTRNIIVHSGITPAHTRAIIEHAHEYLDSIFNVLIKMASHPTQVSTVAEAFKLAQLHYDSYRLSLDDSNPTINNETIADLYFMRPSARNQ